MTCALRSKRTLAPLLGLLAAAALTPASAMSLSEAYERAAEHDPYVAASRAQYEADREQGRQEFGSLLPSVTLGGSYYYADTELEAAFGQSQDDYEGWSAQVELRQPLFRAGSATWPLPVISSSASCAVISPVLADSSRACARSSRAWASFRSVPGINSTS